MAPQDRKHKTTGVFALALLAAALLSGCAGWSGGSSAGNVAPVARLDVDRHDAWTGEDFTFDAQDSTDPNGNITQWRFDFGDNTSLNVTTEDAARVKHAYTEGGEYRVTVTVTDDGKQKGDDKGLDPLSSKAYVMVAVDEHTPVAASVVRSGLANDSAPATVRLAFPVHDGADRTVSNVTLQNALLTGASQVTLRIRDASGALLKEQTYTLNSTQARDIDLESDLDNTGMHTLEIYADSGAIRVTGFQDVYYGDDNDLLKNDAGH